MISKLFTTLGAHSPQRYVINTWWIFITKFLSIFISLAATFYVARTLGPQNFGELSYAVSIVGLLGFFSAIAGTSVICRDLIKAPESQSKILGTAWTLSMVGTLLTVVGVIVLTFILPHDAITLYIIGFLCLAQICSPFAVAQTIFFADAKTKYLSLMQLTVHLCVSIAKIISMTFDQGVLVLACIMFAEQLALAIITLALYVRYTHRKVWDWTFDIDYARNLALDSIPFVFISMSIVVSGRIDQVFIKHFVDTSTVGLYSVAVQLTEIWQVLPQILLASLLPALVNSHTSSNSYGKRILALSLVLGLYGISASLITTLLAPFIIPLIYGTAFMASIPLLQIYTWSLFGTVAGFLITNILVTENQRRIQIMVGVIPMLTNVMLNLLWIPNYGAAGAAWATVISYSMAPVIPFFYSSIRQKFYGKKTINVVL